MVDLAAEQYAMVLELLQQIVPGVEVRAFGSRVTGKAKPYSDLDLVVCGSEKLGPLLGELESAFSESDLPIRVDVLDWHLIPDHFKTEISANSVVIQESSS